MTYDEVETKLNDNGYQIEDDQQSHQYKIYDKQNVLIAAIGKDEENQFIVYGYVPQHLLTNVILHFAYTPLHERLADQDVELDLSESEIKDLQKIKIPNILTDMNNMELSNDQLHALRHIKKQLNRQLSEQSNKQSKSANDTAEATDDEFEDDFEDTSTSDDDLAFGSTAEDKVPIEDKVKIKPSLLEKLNPINNPNETK